jgi:peptide-methionine (R)-S-oxide reductase
MRRLLLVTGVLLASCATVTAPTTETGTFSSIPTTVEGQASSPLTEEQWKAALSPERYAILREAATERPFTSPLLEEHRKGTYVTADCGDPVFRSETKFDSGTGWPSFYAPISEDVIVTKSDYKLGVERIEVLSRCGGHLGHVFPDGPEPTGLRYCMNGLALRFVPDEE